MNDPSAPAPLVAQALQSLRDKAPASERIPASPSAGTPTQTTPAQKTRHQPAPARATPAPKTQAEPDPPQARRHPSQIRLEPAPTQLRTDARSSVELDQPSGAPSTSLGSALDALRIVSVSAQTRLANPGAFPELPMERELSDLGPYVEHVMREAQAAAGAYRNEADRETSGRAAEQLSAATVIAGRIRQEADAYSERTRAQADALLAERAHRIAELTERLSQMAQLAGEEFAGDQTMRNHMMQFISALTAAAEEAITDLHPNPATSSDGPRADSARPRRNARP